MISSSLLMPLPNHNHKTFIFVGQYSLTKTVTFIETLMAIFASDRAVYILAQMS